MMSTLQHGPKLGHITTFGGNPVIAAACLATLREITANKLIANVVIKEELIRKRLKHRLIREIRGKGLMLALIMESPEIANHLILTAAKKRLILFWLLFEKKAVRISPPLTISLSEIEKGCETILEILNDYRQ
jgi:acetylornithine/succinyldiaminopimelate/putrescine aminotransferase